MKAILILGAAILMVGCATPTVVDTRKAGDAQLTCDQIKLEVAEAERFDKEARKERTVTGTNVAAALFFLPGLIGTYVNTDQAINAAKERKDNLFKLAESKGCKV
jgi:hypothetical protein